jgi:carbonic anhydrase
MVKMILGLVAAMLLVASVTLGVVNTLKGKSLEKQVLAVRTELKETKARVDEVEAGGHHEDAAKAHADAAPHWAYEGEMGPDHWGSAFPTCASGKSQSPLDIKEPFEKGTYEIKPNYTTGQLKILNNGHTIQVNVPPGSTMRVNAETFELLQFHFHRPSEEHINGKPMDMVVHFVHKSEAGKLAVIGVLLKEGADNEAIKTLWANAPQKEGPEVVVENVKFNPANLLPTRLNYYHYEGSLTTPPCTEGVAFFILNTPVHVSKAQVEAFPFKLNARPVQPQNGRKIYTK